MTGSGAARGSPPITSRRATQPGTSQRRPETDEDPGGWPRSPTRLAARRSEQLVAEYYEKGKALSTAAAFEIDDVIDPAQTRHVLIETLARTRS